MTSRFLSNASVDDRPLRVVALTGCDGSGKSTLAAELLLRLREQGPTAPLYLGQSSGRIAEWIESLPLIGAATSRFLRAKSDRVHARPSSPPGNVAALVIYGLSRWRVHKFKRMLKLSRRGVLVVTDRYPQAEIPGFRFDGPQLAKTQGGNAWIRTLRDHERKLYDWMATAVPALVIRLNVDAETAHARKPDHPLEVLREKIAAWPQLRFGGARILDVDARQDASVVLHESLRAIDLALQAAPA